MKTSGNYIKDYYLNVQKKGEYLNSDSAPDAFEPKAFCGLRAAVLGDSEFRSVKKEINFMIYRLLKNGKEKEVALKKEIAALKAENAELKRKIIDLNGENGDSQMA